MLFMRWKGKDLEGEDKRYHDEYKGVQLRYVSPGLFQVRAFTSVYSTVFPIGTTVVISTIKLLTHCPQITDRC